MATKGLVLGRITVPTGGWSCSVTGPGGSGTATVTAGSYYTALDYTGTSTGASSGRLLSALAGALFTATGDTWTVDCDYGESTSNTQKVTISTGGTFSITWTDTDLRDVLGFNINLSGSSSYTATYQPKGAWVPDCVYVTPHGQFIGSLETDARVAESPSGDVYTFYGTRKEIYNFHWPCVSLSRVHFEGDNEANDTFYEFWRDVLLGELDYFPVGDPIIVYPDADNESFGIECYVAGEQLRTFHDYVTKVRDDWLGLWRVELNRLVVIDKFLT